MRRLLKYFLIAVALIVAIFAGNFVYGWKAGGPSTRDITVVIKPGSGIQLTAYQLQKGGVLSSAEAFITRARVFGATSVIKAGEYLIPAGASNAQVLAIITGNKTIQRMVTIPEGMPAIMVYERLMANSKLSGDIAVPAEGSIMPDSYSFDAKDTKAAVLARMQAAMTQALSELWPKRSAEAVVKTPQEAVILASIVEKETSLKKELALVAGVYSNRITKGMMLQADPTIIYPITKGKPLGRRIHQSEISAVNDYNTYAMVGLPKGPIANPSRAAIEAVLRPAKTEALFFVADGSGGHVFANTVAEHNANVEKWYALRKARGEM